MVLIVLRQPGFVQLYGYVRGQPLERQIQEGEGEGRRVLAKMEEAETLPLCWPESLAAAACGRTPRTPSSQAGPVSLCDARFGFLSGSRAGPED